MEVLVYVGSILWTSFRVLTAKTMPLGDALVVVNSISSVAYTFQDSIQRLFEFHEHSLYIENLRYFLQYEPSIRNDPKGLPVSDFRGLEFHNVSFHYAGQETEVLHQVNMRIRAGEKIALVGQNGAGKSTIVKLLMRLYDPAQGGDPTQRRGYPPVSFRRISRSLWGRLSGLSDIFGAGQGKCPSSLL